MTAWPGLSRADHDTGSKARASLVTDLLDATAHDREVLYDSATQLPDAPHVHSGGDSELLVMPDVPNLVTDSHPQATAAHDDVNEWARSGVGVTEAGLRFTGSGQYATHLLGDRGRKAQFAGCDMVLALLARAHQSMTSLAFRFGITNGHSASFVAGTMAEADETEVPAGGYRRYYTVVQDFDSTAFSNDVRIGVAIAGSYAPAGTQIDVTAVVVKPCSVLPMWEPGYYTRRQHNWELIGMNGIALWDEQLNFDRALYVAPA